MFDYVLRTKHISATKIVHGLPFTTYTRESK